MPDRKRVQLYRVRAGWRFRYQKQDGPGRAWRTVDTRGEGTTWDYDEAVRRATSWAALLGASLVQPPPGERG